MCERDCIYRGGTVQKWHGGQTSCGYSAAMALTNRKYKTRTKQLWLKVEKKHPNWDQKKKQKWVTKHLQGENCPFFEEAGEDGKRAPFIIPPAVTKKVKPKEETRREPFTKLDEERARKLYDRGLNDQEAADALGNVGRSTMYYWRKRNGLPPNGKKGGPGKQRTMVNREKLRELYDMGLSDGQIAKRLSCGATTVWKWRTKAGLPSQEQRARQAQAYLEEKERQEGNGT